MISLNKWFRQQIISPIIFANIIMFITNSFLLINAYHVEIIAENLVETRLSNLISNGLIKRNRSYIELAIEQGLQDLKANQINLCLNDRDEMKMNSSTNIEKNLCSSSKVSILSIVRSVPIEGSNVILKYEISVSKYFSFLGLPTLMSFIFLIVVIFLLRRSNQHLTKEIIEPLSQLGNISFLRDGKTFTITQINNAFEIYKKNEENKSLLINAQVNAAIAQTTQMLAHDVRKPFSMIQSLLNILSKSTSLESTKKLVVNFTPEINNALQSVNGMIADIMEVGSQSNLTTETVETTTMIHTATTELFRYNDKAKINIVYDLSHKHNLDINPLKVLRIFSNILGNAIQAMNNKGDIWIKTKELDGFIEFCIGNSGSFIPSEDIPHLFEAFFTKNKKGGTGLGLAIAKKIVTTHGGTICCKSSKELGVEFYFTLPIAVDSFDSYTTLLSSSSKEIYDSLLTQQLHSDNETTTSQFINEEEIIDLLKEKKAKLNILVVDDESIYTHLIQHFITPSESLSSFINIDAKHHIDQIIEQVLSSNYPLILLDVDLKAEKNGFEISKELKNKGFKGKICIHSNRGSFEFKNEFKNSEADLMIPKPMSKEQFLSLSLSIAKDLPPTITVDTNKLEDEDKLIAILDDSNMTLTSWKILTPEVKKIMFRSPELFLNELEKDPILLEQLKCVITDFDFSGVNSSFDGVEFAKYLRKRNFTAPIFLFSGADFHPSELTDIIDGQLPKSVKEAWNIVAKKLDNIS